MGGVADAVGGAISKAWNAVVDVVEVVWDEVAMPILEEVFSWFGIEDETVVHVQKSSVMIYGDNTLDVIQQTKIRAVMAMVQLGGSFFPHYWKEVINTRAQMRAYYQYGESDKYIWGLPDMEIKAGDIDFAAVDLALDDYLGVAATRLTVSAQIPPDEIYFKHKYQTTPYFYLPRYNSLTKNDQWGVSWTDWKFTSVVYNSGPNNYSVNVTRQADQALFWIEGLAGSNHITEGGTATYVIKCNRVVPAGKTATVNLAYTGTAVDSTDYTSVSSVDITAGNQEQTFDIVTIGNASADGSRTMIITIDSVPNTGGVFEAVDIYALDSVTTTILDDDAVVLTMDSIIATESAGTVTIPVTLGQATTGTFDVDYNFTDGSAIGGIDYTNTTGTLTFAGTAGEVQNIVVPITTGDGNDDDEDFTVFLENCTDGTVDISGTCHVLITDGTGLDPSAQTIDLVETITEAAYTPVHSLIVSYHLDTDPAADWFYWLYDLSLGTYPDVEPELHILSNFEMMPVAIIRHDKVFIDTDKETEEYKTTRMLMGRMGLDIDDVISNVAQSPSIDQLDDVFINFSLSPNTEHHLISKMMWKNFYFIIVTEGLTSTSDQYSASFSEQDVQSSVVWKEHSHTTGLSISGDSVFVSNTNDYEHEIVDIPEESHYDYDAGENVIDVPGGKSLLIRHKTGANEYEQLEIKYLNSMAAIEYDGYHKMAVNTLGDDAFTIPISHFMMEQLTPFEYMQIYQYLVRIDVYAIEIVHLEWYETAAFLTLFQFAMIAITVVTAGLAGGFLAVVQQLVINYLVMELVIFVAELTGNAEFAAIVGIVAVIALGGVTGNMPFDFKSAQGVLQASTQFADNLTAGYNTLTEGLAEDLEELNRQAEEAMEKHKEAMGPESAITAEFLVALKSVDTTSFPAIKAQYNFDLYYNYDSLVGDYHDIKLQTGVR